MEGDRTQKAMVAMSGGVDSSVAALLALQAGFDATGVTCKMFGSNVMGDASDAFDAFLDEVDDAKQVCRALGIEHYVLNCKDAFERCVIQAFVDAYRAGRTPNPCVDCNRHVKFGALQRRRAEMGFDVLVTGHYARVGFDAARKRWVLRRARHAAKDQSYMLCQLSQEQLACSLFPLGNLSKGEVRALAAEAGFGNARKGESQDICFVADGDYAAFIERWAARKGAEGAENAKGAMDDACAKAEADAPPLVQDASGKVLGLHEGLIRYTVGQRKGLGIAVGEPLYVLGKDAKRNVLIVGRRDELLTRHVAAGDVTFVSLGADEGAGATLPALAKTTYRQKPRPCMATFSDEGVTLEFDEPIVRPASGQTLALYDAEAGDAVLAGATIA